MSTVTTQLNTGSTPLPIASGGTGVATFTTAYTPICSGTTATGALQPVSSTGLAVAGSVLTSNGSSALPTFQTHNMTVATLPLSASNMLNMTATPIQIIAAQGAHTIIIVYLMEFEYLFNSVAFSAAGDQLLIYGSNPSASPLPSIVATAVDLTASANGIAYASPIGYGGTLVNSSLSVNAGVYITNSVALTGSGNGSARLKVYYDVLTTTF